MLQSLWKEVYVSLISRLCNTRDEGGSIIFMKFAGKRGSILKLTNGLVTSFNKKLMHHIFQYNETDKDKVCYCYPSVQDSERQVSFTWIRPIVCLIYDHGLAWFSRKVNTVCTFVNQVLQCSGLVYIGVHFPTPNKRHVLMSAQIKHGRRMARLKTWKIIILSNITNLEINLQIFVCISLRAIAILRKDCVWYYCLLI